MKSEWKQVYLSDMCELVAGFAFKSKHFGDYSDKVIKIANITPPTVSMNDLVGIDLSQYDHSKLERFFAHSGDYVLAMTGATIGKIGRLEQGGAYVNQRVLLFKNRKDKIDKDFLYYALQQYSFAQYILGHIDSESAQPNISSNTIGKFQFALPHMVAQKKIGRLLRIFDEKIELNRNINENLERQAQEIFQRWLFENDGQYTFRPLAEVAKINSDTYSPKESWEYVNYLDTSSITDGTISEIQHICPKTEKLPSRARRKVQKGDIVYSTVRPNQRHFGIISSPLPNMLVSTGFAVIRSKQPQICNELIYLLITDSNFIEKMQQLAEQSTSTFPSIKPSDLGTCLIPYPIGTNGDELSTQLKTLYSFIAINNVQNEKLAVLRDTLLPQLMSGEIDLQEG